MALTGEFVDNNGITHENAYAKIVVMQIESNQAHFFVSIFPDAQSRTDDYGSPIHQEHYHIPMSEFNGPPFEVTYRILKTKEPYSNWIDS